MSEDVERNSLELGLVCGGGTQTPPESFCDLASLPLPSLGAPAGNDGFPTEAPEELRLVRGHDMYVHTAAFVCCRHHPAKYCAH